MRAATQPGQRIIIAVPPRHGKSTTCSQYGPAWFLRCFPDKRVMLCSYGATLASEFGGDARDALNLACDTGLSPYRVRQDSSAKHSWRVEGGKGGMLTAGVGGGITGFGADLLICDDLIKSDKEASSKVIREAAWNWLQSTALTRLEPGGSVIVIATRWHQDDPTGRLLERQAGKWEVISFPALAEDDDILGRRPGDALWPERYPVSVLREVQKEKGQYIWASLYQQRPAPREGGLFKREWFDIVDAAPATAKRVRAWDLAATEGAGDFTAGVRIALADGVYYIEDIKRDQLSPLGVKKLREQTASLDGASVQIVVPQDPGQAGKEQAVQMVQDLDGYNIRARRETGDKETRATPVSAQAEAGNVKLVRGAWNADFLDEVAAFPNGSNDDQVDALSAGYAVLCKRPAAKVYY